MKKTLLWTAILLINLSFSQNPITNGSDWNVSNLTSDNALDYPNEITYGPDDYLWITERVGKNVVKIDKTTGAKTTMLDLSSSVYQSVTQDGLLGMAIHPDLYSDLNATNNYVYVAYTYWDTSVRKVRIERYTYNSGTGNLNSGSATTILEGLPANNDHNGGRLKIGPDLKLYYGIGDQGYNQGSNSCSSNRAQIFPTSTSDYDEYQGKIIRINLDGGIPTDNPTFGGIKSHVYTVGHRNPQGLIFAQDGKLYSSEHGPKVDDELNIIESGKNYGWPEIAGYYDDQGYEYCDWGSSASCASWGNNNPCPVDVTSLPESVSGMPTDYKDPIGTYDSTVASDPSGGWFSWPTVGPSSIDIYEGGEVPGWGKSLFITTLKRGTIFRTKLNASGDALDDGTYEEFHSSNDRYRDLAMDPDGVTMYAITDNTGGTTGPGGTTGVSIQNPGVVVKIEFTGITLSNSEKEANAFSISPNPAKNYFDVHFNSLSNWSSINIDIIDIRGRTIKSYDNVINQNRINTRDLTNGMYFVKFISDNKVISTKKILVSK
jgi:PQQ-dependent dehydrogenase (s-GDH family)